MISVGQRLKLREGGAKAVEEAERVAAVKDNQRDSLYELSSQRTLI